MQGRTTTFSTFRDAQFDEATFETGYVHLRNARNYYDHWGASGKVNQLDEGFPRLREARTLAAAATAGPPVA